MITWVMNLSFTDIFANLRPMRNNINYVSEVSLNDYNNSFIKF